MLPEEFLQNLDDQWSSDLYDYADVLAAHEATDPETAKVRDALVAYARTRAAAMNFRQRGWATDIARATRLERECERIYEGLPGWARW
jgi:hypothetical protein